MPSKHRRPTPWSRRLPALAVVPVVGLVVVAGVRLASDGTEDGSITLTGIGPTASAPTVAGPAASAPTVAGPAGLAASDPVPAPVPVTSAKAKRDRAATDGPSRPDPAARSARAGTTSKPSTPTRPPAAAQPAGAARPATTSAAVAAARTGASSTRPATSTQPSTQPSNRTSTRTPTSTSKPVAAVSSSSRPPTSSAVPVADGSLADQVVALTNVQRQSAGCRPLSIDGTLTSVAQAHSADMARRQFFDHVNPDGASPFDRMTAAGYRYRMAAENIAAGYRTPQQVVDGWMNSAGHRKNILNCALTEIGVGYVTGGSYGTYWTQNFGTPAG